MRRLIVIDTRTSGNKGSGIEDGRADVSTLLVQPPRAEVKTRDNLVSSQCFAFFVLHLSI